MNWLARLFRRTTLERDLDRELRFHLDEQANDYVRLGLTPEEARRRARLELGGVEQVKEAARDARGTRWVEDWWQDTRYALRAMMRAPAFTAAAVLTLAIGIGANTAVWSVVDALMLRSLAVRHPEELHAIRREGIEDPSYRLAHATLMRMRAHLGADGAPIAAMSSTARMYASVGDSPDPVTALLVSGNWFQTLGIGTALGRPITPQDDSTLGGEPVVVLSDAFWRRRFGNDHSVVGRTMRINGTPLTVIGIAEPGFAGLEAGGSVDVFIPIAMQHEVRYRGNSYSSDSDTEKPWVPQVGIQWLTLIARVPPDEARALATTLDVPFRAVLTEQLARQDSVTRAKGMRERVGLEPVPRGFSGLRGQFEKPLQALMVSVGLLLLISCGNLAGLLLARSASRTHEIALRISLGARAGRLVRQALTESITLAVLGGTASLMVANWGTQALLRLASTGSRPIPLAASLNGRVLLFAFAVSIGTGLLFGLAPALRVLRADLYESFRSAGRVVRASHRLPLGRVLVVSQIALSLVLVVSAALFVRTFQNYMNIDPGYERERLIQARIDVRAAGYTHGQLPALYRGLLDAARNVPGVTSASLSVLSLAGGGRRIGGFTIPGSFPPGPKDGQENYVTPDYFATVGMPLLRGRHFTDMDRDGSQRVVIISESTAQKFFGTDNAIGAKFGYGTPPELEVVGIVADARVNELWEKPSKLVFHALAQGPQEYVTTLDVRVATAPPVAIPAIRRAISSVDRNLPIREVVAVSTLLERGLNTEKMLARLASAFGVLALILAGIGLYGVMSYSVARRTNEMGVRLALGASPTDVSWVVLRDSLITVVAGLGIGVMLWLPLVRLARKLVYDVSPHDPVMLGIAGTLLLLVGITAGLIPAWRASRINPVEAIRSE